jgi:hypothetical protein
MLFNNSKLTKLSFQPPNGRIAFSLFTIYFSILIFDSLLLLTKLKSQSGEILFLYKNSPIQF